MSLLKEAKMSSLAEKIEAKAVVAVKPSKVAKAKKVLGKAFKKKK